MEVGFSWVGGGVVPNQRGDVTDPLNQMRTTLLAQGSDHDFTLSSLAHRDLDLNQFMVRERAIHLLQYRGRQAFTGYSDNRAQCVCLCSKLSKFFTGRHDLYLRGRMSL
jgi:hypothetical protein